jgi:serine/threonine protein kinase
MAPEQTLGQKGAIGPATDVYALGAILYELLTGRTAFQASGLFELFEQIRTGVPVPPRTLVSGLPRALEAICLKCLEKDPTRRYDSAVALADDLRSFQAGKPTQVPWLTPWTDVLTLRWNAKWGSREKLVMAAYVVLLPAVLINIAFSRPGEAWFGLVLLIAMLVLPAILFLIGLLLPGDSRPDGRASQEELPHTPAELANRFPGKL